MITRLLDIPAAMCHWLIWRLFELGGLVTPTKRR